MSIAAVPTPLLETREASIRFGGLQALTNFSLQIRSGDLYGLIGPNGAGKTTAFNLLTGVYQPTSGDVLVGGRSIRKQRPHRITRIGVARTFQNIRLFKALSALDNVRVACGSRGGVGEARILRGGHPLAAIRETVGEYAAWWRALLRSPRFLREEAALTRRADELLRLMGLGQRRDEIASSLPYGEQRRLEIARALGTEPKVLLLDEPAAGMNTREKLELMQLIRKLRDDLELGILVIEHDMKLVMGICEHITVLDHGETIARGTPQEVRESPKVIEAYLGVDTERASVDSGSRR
jgi:branched-chain amino acid transport system ATP-binding protein